MMEIGQTSIYMDFLIIDMSIKNRNQEALEQIEKHYYKS